MKQVALVTGASRGIGLGIALELAKQNFDIAIMDIMPKDQATDGIKTLENDGAKVLYCQGSISSTEDRERVMAEIKDEFGCLNVLVNNAGIAPRERNDVLMTTEKSFDDVLKINLYGTYFMTQRVANWLVEQKQADPEFQGSIINISSISSTVVSVNRGEYCISKAGVSMTTSLFAARLGEYDIPVFEIRPGVIKTDMTAGVTEKYNKLIAEGLTVQQRWGFPEDIGKAAATLASGDIPYATGTVIMIDGGLTIPRL